MNCPVCNNTHLQFSENTGELYSFSCTKCRGTWIRLNDYLKWLNLTNKSEYELFIKNDLANFKSVSTDATLTLKSDYPCTEIGNDEKTYSVDDLICDYVKGDPKKQSSDEEILLGLEVKEPTAFKNNHDGSFVTVIDSKKAKLCPDCGRILIKYKVNNSLNFSVEHCGTCSGVWFDANKWETLSDYKLNDKVYRFFTEPWQRRIREEATKSYLDKKYNNKFGKNDYEKIKSIKTWLDSNNNRREIIAYLLKNDPYKIQ